MCNSSKLFAICTSTKLYLRIEPWRAASFLEGLNVQPEICALPYARELVLDPRCHIPLQAFLPHACSMASAPKR